MTQARVDESTLGLARERIEAAIDCLEAYKKRSKRPFNVCLAGEAIDALWDAESLLDNAVDEEGEGL